MDKSQGQARLDALIASVARMPEVLAIGRSGDLAFPAPGESDVDIFLYCESIPPRRDEYYPPEAVQVDCFDSAQWGVGDFAEIEGVEICLMYFLAAQAEREMEETLAGRRIEAVGDFFPTGRLASLQSMHILCDRDGFLKRIQARLAHYPPVLAEALIARHLDALDDAEDFARAVKRQDVLFYHHALDRALDHFLQALFARNRVYFPSRKRTLAFLDGFAVQPADCGARLLEILRLGATGEGVEKSRRMFDTLTEELRELCR